MSKIIRLEKHNRVLHLMHLKTLMNALHVWEGSYLKGFGLARGSILFVLVAVFIKTLYPRMHINIISALVPLMVLWYAFNTLTMN